MVQIAGSQELHENTNLPVFTRKVSLEPTEECPIYDEMDGLFARC